MLISAPGLRATEDEISSTSGITLSASTALPMRASLNIETTACLDSATMLEARSISAAIGTNFGAVVFGGV